MLGLPLSVRLSVDASFRLSRFGFQILEGFLLLHFDVFTGIVHTVDWVLKAWLLC